MKRRRALQYGTLLLASCLSTACQGGNFPNPLIFQPEKLDFGPLEKANLTLGFLPLTDAAPLLVAQEKGFFARQGLSVSLRKQGTWQEIERGLLEWRFDAAQALFSLPLLAQLGPQAAPLISLMVLNLNGSAITLSAKAWEAGLRPLSAYTNFPEFAYYFRQYCRSFSEPLPLGIDSPISMDSYLLRYWLAAMGIAPEREVKLVEVAAPQSIYKLQAGVVRGYCTGEPWNQQAVQQQAGFVSCTSRDIWQGHPGQVLAAMDGWVRKHPATARALVAAVLQACQFCDRPENRREVAEILSRSQYLNLAPALVEPSLTGKYFYSTLKPDSQPASIPDLHIFHFQPTDYLQPPDQANYPWRSHAVWLLTQVLRWHQLGRTEYPQDADKILEKTYPVEVYKDVAEALNIAIPKGQMKSEPAKVFIDQRAFDPSEPVAYLNQFSIRT